VKVQFAKFYQSVNLPKGAKTSLNDNECTSMETTEHGLMITTLEGERYLVPWSNLPFVRLEDSQALPVDESQPMVQEAPPAIVQKAKKPNKAK
jgi:hypothetical protein